MASEPSYAPTIILGFICVAVIMYLVMIYPSERANLVSGGQTVVITGASFLPANLQVNVGTTVKWVNQDTITHTVSGEKFESGAIPPGSSYSYKFDSPGDYSYSCLIHPSQHGSITVR